VSVHVASLVVGLVVGLGAPSGVSISPDDRDPRIVIEGEQIKRGGHGRLPDHRIAWPGGQRPETDEERVRREVAKICPVWRRVQFPGFPCLLIPPGPPQPGAPRPEGRQISPEEIERAIREIDLPGQQVRVEPSANTLVNLPTNLYARVEDVERSVDVVGHTVRLRATAAQYTWHHGDGTSQRTDSPGAPYPDLAVTHRYRRPADRLQVSLEVGYRVEYAVDDGDWRRLPELITASGPPTPLIVHEASPILVRP